MLSLPSPRGAAIAFLLDHLAAGPPHTLPGFAPPPTADALVDDDLHLALYLCYELHYGGLPGEMDLALRAIADADDGPSLSRHLELRGTREELLEFLVHRSA